MAWSASAIFTAFLTDALENTTAFDLGITPDTVNVALFNNSVTPDQTVSAANSVYNVAQWGTANETYEAGQWAQGGVALTSPDISNPTTTTVMFDASDTASGSTADITNAYGALVYDQTLATKYGICYNYFGGANSVVNGTFTVVWHANGIFRFTL